MYLCFDAHSGIGIGRQYSLAAAQNLHLIWCYCVCVCMSKLDSSNCEDRALLFFA